MTDRRWHPAVGIGIRLAVAAAALTWTFSRAPMGEVLDAFGRMNPLAIAAAVGLFLLLMTIGAVRWGWILTAYGAAHIPLSTRLNLLLVGNFYNTFLPGAVLGDMARSHLSRQAFGGGGGAYVTVLLDRVVGLVGLLVLCGGMQLIRPVAGIAGLQIPALLGLLAGLGAASVPFLGQRMARFAPEPVAGWLRELPVVQRPGLLASTLVLGMSTHLLLAVIAHLMLMDLAPHLAFADTVIVVPLAMVSVYFPATVAGLGVREMALITLFAPLGVDAPTAAAVSFGLLGLQVLFGLVGGLLSVVAPVVIEAPTET